MLVETFAIPDERKLQSLTVEKLSSTRLTAGDIDELLTTSQFAIEDAAFEDDHSTAQKITDIALRLPRRAKDAETVRKLSVHAVQLKRLKREYVRITTTLSTSSSNADPSANYSVGRYFCFLKGQWDKGLPMLSEGDDLPSRRLANEELRASPHPDVQAAVADGWWELSLDQPSFEREQLRKHAVAIYEQSLDGLQGLAKTKIPMRIEEFYRKFSDGHSPRTLAIRHPGTTLTGARRSRSRDRNDN